ncbi:hypothetical protein BGX28_007789 [Mortierella sp. GBA30]|nr:hypothetical protein BGX28_007789 [Mortierella sp. GBA30]
MYNPKNYRKLTRSQDDYKAYNIRPEIEHAEITTLYSPQTYAEPDWSSADASILSFDFFLNIADEPQSQALQEFMPHQFFDEPLAFAAAEFGELDSWYGAQNTSMVSNKHGQSNGSVAQQTYPSPMLSPLWSTCSNFNASPSPAPLPLFTPIEQISSPTTAALWSITLPVPSNAPCAVSEHEFLGQITQIQEHQEEQGCSAEPLPQNPSVPACPPTKPRSMSLKNLTKKSPNKTKNSDGKIHHCPYCSKAFSRPYNLNSHIRTHSSEKPHVCHFDGCQKAFLRPYDLARHERNHNGLLPFICGVCVGDQVAFKRHEGLRRHHKSEHPEIFQGNK